MDKMPNLFDNKKNIIKIILDIICICIGTGIATILRYEKRWDENFNVHILVSYTIIYMVFYLYNGMANKSWSYTNSSDTIKVIRLNIYTFFIQIVYLGLFRIPYSRTIIFSLMVFSIIGQLMIRLLFRLKRKNNLFKGPVKGKNTLIYGAGESGSILAREKFSNKKFNYNIVGFIDDDKRKKYNYIYNIEVLGGKDILLEAIEKKKVEIIIIAISTIEKKEIKEIINLVKDKNIKVKILPSVESMLTGESTLQGVRDVSVEDLLGRDQIVVNDTNIKRIIIDKIVFITGAAGSIGSELAKQISKHRPKKIIMIDVNENDIYFLELELRRKYPNLDLQCEICNIREKDKVELLFELYRPEIVVHAAAHKHVPLMEHNPEEAVKNNLFGTHNVVEMADKYRVERFVLISTDKAVNPTNVMGATKRGCELIVEKFSKTSKTKFMAVRFGNVLGSNGSVIPIFRKLLLEGKNLTLTHPDITRYFMTIPEAVQLVMEAGSIGQGGELFILDMGKPVKIMELAKTMIELSNADAEIEIVGLRPGEKLYEELLYDVNSGIKTSNPKIFKTVLDDNEVDIKKYLDLLREKVKVPVKEDIKDILKEFIVSYKEV